SERSERTTAKRTIVSAANEQQRSVAVLLPAAGQGRRLGGARKQFRRLGGETLLVQTLRVFDAHPLVDHLVVAAPVEEVDALRADLSAAGFRTPWLVVAGGVTRQD